MAFFGVRLGSLSLNTLSKRLGGGGGTARAISSSSPIAPSPVLASQDFEARNLVTSVPEELPLLWAAGDPYFCFWALPRRSRCEKPPPPPDVGALSLRWRVGGVPRKPPRPLGRVPERDRLLLLPPPNGDLKEDRRALLPPLAPSRGAGNPPVLRVLWILLRGVENDSGVVVPEA